MAKQLLFYENVAPISAKRHKNWSIGSGEGLDFAANVNAVPLMSSEFQTTAAELPIVFGKSEDRYAPIAVLGTEKDKCLLITEDGKWKGNYVPAFIRRYPFVFAEGEDKKTYTLCIDEDFTGIDQTGESGQRFYTDDDKPSEFLDKALAFAKNFEMEGRRTTEFCRLLAEQGLFDPMKADIRSPSGETRHVTGFHVISRERLKELDDSVVQDFFKRDILELVYAHLHSLRNFEKLQAMAT